MRNFRVHYKRQGHKKGETSNWHAADLNSLRATLKRSEGIALNNVECLYVHEIREDGSVMELLAYEEVNGNVHKLDTSPKEPTPPIDKRTPAASEQALVVSVVERAIEKARTDYAQSTETRAKPRIRLKATTATSTHPSVVGGYLYKAVAAE